MGSADEQHFLFFMASKGGKVLEIGTGAGGSSLLMALAMQDANIPGEIHTIGWDPDEANMANTRKRINNWPNLAKRIKMYEGKSADLAGKFPNGQFDFIYIDGDHSYEGVKADIKNYLPKLKPGGVIGFHDTNQEYVQKAIREDIKFKEVAHIDRIRAYLKPKDTNS
jgi:predicted O-methyltransferase YrrM